MVANYDKTKEELMDELYKEESMRKKFGKENFLRSATVKGGDIFISELMSEEYILKKGC